jgi:hypothetical protein
MANVSPGVFSKIIDLSTFVQAVPSTIGMLCGLTEKGEDNVLKFIGGRSEFITEFGEPNIATYGKNYGQAPYIAYNYLGESGAFYFMRVMPDDAAYSNMRIDVVQGATDTSASMQITYVSSLNSKAEIKTNLSQSGSTYPLAFLYPIGRGEYYNAIGVRFTEVANPLSEGVYILDIYEKQSDGEDEIVESFEVSFDPKAQDTAGNSIWIVDVLANFSAFLRCEMNISDEVYSPGYNLLVRAWDQNIGSVSASITSGSAWISDNKQVFTDWQEADTTNGTADYLIVAIDAKGNKLWGWAGAAFGSESESVEIYNNRNLSSAVQAWIGDTSVFDVNSDITYEVRKAYTSVANAFTSSTPVPMRRGSEGSLLDTAGDLDTTVATQLLNQGYTGVIDGDVLDTENVYFSIVFDAGYPADVKTAISTLCQTRRDCVGILDNGDNSTFNASINARNNTNTFNNYFVALYESYNKVYDAFTGQDIWVSPVYHMAYILPRNDTVAQLWFAAAGFNRAAIDTIKELRYNPRLGQRDQLYLKQLNPIVKFNPGYVVWGQLTSQAKASALQDLNIVRLVLYIQRAFEQFCRFYIFEQNDAITWNEVSGQLVAFLEVIKKQRGLYSYSVDVGATDYERRTKKFHVDVILEPTRVVEQIQLNFFIQ